MDSGWTWARGALARGYSELGRIQLRTLTLETPTDQVVEWTLLHAVTPIDDIVMVEDISDDEEAIPQK